MLIFCVQFLILRNFLCCRKEKRLSSIAHFWVKLRFNLMWLLARRGRQLPVCPVQVGFNSAAAAAAALVKLIVFIVLHSSNTNTISNMDTVMRIVFYCTTLSSAW